MTAPAGVELDAPPPPRRGRFVKPRPQVALAVLLIAAAFPVRFAVGGGSTASVFDAAVAALVVPLLFMAARPAVLTAPPRSLVLAAVVPTVLTVASLLWTRDVGRSVLWVVSWVECLVVLWFVTTTLRDQYPRIVMRWIARFALLLLVAPVLMYVGVAGFEPPAELSRTSGDYISYYARFSHPFIGRSNNLASLLAVLFLPLAYWAARYRAHRVTMLLVGVALVLTQSRGVLLSVALAGLFLVVRSREQAGRILRRLVAPLFLGAAGLLVVLAFNPLVAEHIASRGDLSNVTARSGLLAQAQAAIGVSPLYGLGAGVGENVHNTYVQQLVYFGVPLGLVAAWFVARAARSFFGRDDLSRAAGLGVVAALVSFLAESSLEGTLLRPLLFLSFALLGALALSGERLQRDPAGPTGR